MDLQRGFRYFVISTYLSTSGFTVSFQLIEGHICENPAGTKSPLIN